MKATVLEKETLTFFNTPDFSKFKEWIARLGLCLILIEIVKIRDLASIP